MIEYRVATADIEAPGEGVIRGLAIPFNQETIIGDLKKDGFREKIAPGAVTKSIKDGDVVALLNHDSSRPLARVSAGSLALENTERGVEASITPSEVSYANDLRTLIKDKVIRGFSFGFETVKDEWRDEEGNASDSWRGTDRVIREMKLIEISPVTFPAYGMTDISARDSVAAAREGRAGNTSGTNSRTAKATWSDLETCGECGATNQYGAYCTGCGEPMSGSKPSGDYCSSCGSKISDQRDHSCIPEKRAKKAKKPYGNVKYADPKNGKYPIDTEAHIRAAWAYVNVAKNAAKYPLNGVTLSSVKSKIKAAAKKTGIDISGEKKSSGDIDLAGYDETAGFETREVTAKTRKSKLSKSTRKRIPQISENLKAALRLLQEADPGSLPENAQQAIALVSSASTHAGHLMDHEKLGPCDALAGDGRAGDTNDPGETREAEPAQATPDTAPDDDALRRAWFSARSREIQLGI